MTTATVTKSGKRWNVSGEGHAFYDMNRRAAVRVLTTLFGMSFDDALAATS